MNDLTMLNDLIYTCGGQLDSGGNQLFSPFKLSVKMYAILSILGDGPLTNSELAAVVRGSPSSVAQKMSVLVKRGLVERTQDAQDRRVRHFEITAAGRELLASVHPSYRAAMEILYRGVNADDAAAAVRVLQRLLTNLEELRGITPHSGE